MIRYLTRPVLFSMFALAGALLFAACAGGLWVSPGDVLRAIGGEQTLDARLIVEWRLPRILAAAIVGAMLGIGGAIFQGVFRNPLAEPYLLGSAGGASVGATIALLIPMGLPSFIVLATMSFAGAWGATWLVVSVARLAGSIDAASLLLSGIAVAALLGAVRSFLMLALSDETVSLQVVLSWTLGGIQTPTWPMLGVLAVLGLLSLLLTMSLAHGLDLLGLGEEQAQAFGLDVRRFLNWAVLCGALVVALAVAWGGLVAFVGLVAPHVARWTAGPRHQVLIPASAVIGAVLVLLCDGIARSALPPAEIPLGLVTALFGAPAFLIILARKLR